MPPSVMAGREASPSAPDRLEKAYFHWMRCTVAGPYSTVRA